MIATATEINPSNETNLLNKSDDQDMEKLDKRFSVEVISYTPNPQTIAWVAMHQDHSEDYVWDTRHNWPEEKECGSYIIKHLLSGGKGHYGPLEHPSIVFAVGNFPHSTMVQSRSHRVGISFDCQSQRFTGKRVIKVALGEIDVEDVFYVRPVGHYTDRQGKKYYYSEQDRYRDLERCKQSALWYTELINAGVANEQARDVLCQGIRQSFVVSFDARSLLHFLDLRFKSDAQLEIQELSRMFWLPFKLWMPEIANWYEQNRLNKAKLAP